MRRKIKTRVILLILYVFVVFISALLIFLFISEKSNRRIIKEVGKNKEHEIIQLFDIYTTALKKFTYDYSFWNETVEYLKKPDPVWAKENLQDATIVYDVDRILLIDSSFSIKYLYPPTLGSVSDFPFLTVENLKLVTVKDTLVHFFYQTGQNKVTEVMGAPVRSNIDSAKHTKPAGWLFSFRKIDQEYLNALSRISGGVVTLKPVQQHPVPSYDVETGKISVVVQFNNWRNEAVGYFNVDFISPFLNKIKKERNWFLFIFGLFGLILILVLYWFVQGNITRPFDLILKSLSTRDIKILEDAPNQTLEFEEIKFNIADFFAQETLIREIHLRKEAEESLEKSEHRYQMIVESIPDVVWILDETGRLIYVKPNVKSLTGYTDFELLEKFKSLSILADDVELSVFNDHLQAFVNNGLPFETDIKIVCKDSSNKWVSAKAISPFIQNRVKYFCGRISDITEKKKIESLLFEQEWQFRSLFEQNPVGVALLSLPDLIFLNVNNAFQDMLGYTKDEFLMLSVKDITHPDDYEIEIHNGRETLKELPSFVQEKRYKTKEGKYVWVSLTATYILDKTGNPLMACGVVENINDRKIAEEALRKEQALLYALMNNIPDHIFFKDSSLIFRNANKSFLDFCGLSDKTELDGKTVFELFPEEQANILNEQNLMVLKDKTSMINEEFVFITDKGEKSWKITSKVPVFNTKDEIVGLVGITRDITEQKHKENQLQKLSQELTELNAAKDKFFSIIAHDLKNPFNAILGFSSVLYEDYNDFTDEERKHYLKNIHDASETTFNLIQNMLEWTRAQTGRIDISRDFLDLSILTTDTIKLLKPLADAKGVKLISSISYNSQVYADENMIQFVLRNLVSNAIKFTNPNDRIIISSKTIDHKFAEICIADTGIGISPENLQKLFKIDEQFRMYGTHGEQGTGLGLVVCKEFVELNGGDIFAESQVGKGSQFYFRLLIDNPADLTRP